MAQTFVGEARGGQQLQTLDLAKMCSLAEGKEVEQFCDIVPSVSRYARRAIHQHFRSCIDSRAAVVVTHLTLWLWLSSRKLARIEALSFWITARSSAMVLAARTLRMNCLTEV